MERITGIVMETTTNYVVVMTQSGEFKKVKVTGRIPEIGEEVNIPVARRRVFRMPKANWIAVAAAVILLVIASPLLTMMNQPPEIAMAYVSIDVNPSLELTVGNRYNVMDVHAYNNDGERVLRGLDIKGKQYEEAVAAVRKRIQELGYLQKDSSNKTVVVSVAFLSGSTVNEDEVENTLLASAHSVFSDGETKVATIKNVPVDFRATAMKKGISIGKYAVLIETVTDMGMPISDKNFKDIKEKTISAVISSAGGQPEDIIGKVSEEDEFVVKEKKYLAIMALTDGISNPTIARTENPGSPEQPADSGANEGNGKNKYVDTIRDGGDPEDRNSSSGKDPVPSGAAASPGTGIIPGITASPGTTVPDSTYGVSDGSAGNNNQSIDNVNDKETEENYMGNEDEESTDNNDMYLLRPNF